MWTNTFLVLILNLIVLSSQFIYVDSDSINIRYNNTYSMSLNEKKNINECNYKTEFYDINKLSCRPCPENSSASIEDKFNCKCNIDFKFLKNYGGDQIKCIECEKGLIQSLDGFYCVECDENCQRCPQNSYRSDKNQDGSYYSNFISKCVSCIENSTLIDNSKCDTSFKLLSQTVPILNEPYNFNYIFPNGVAESVYFRENLQINYRLCYENDQKACQSLMNMCVLNLYKTQSNQIDACKSYIDLYKLSLNQNRSNLAWIYFDYENIQNYYEDYVQNDYLIKLKYDEKKCITNKLKFYLAEYELDGKLNDFDRLDIAKLQLCQQNSNLNILSMISLNKKCKLTMSKNNNKPLFYEIYLEYRDKYDNKTMISVPVMIDNQILVKRFFMFESISSNSNYVRYVKSLEIKFELIENKKDGEIYPPLIKIEYDFKSSDSKTEIENSFSIEYKMNVDKQIKWMNITIGILCGLAFIWSSFRIYVWNRRSIRYFIDVIFMFKFFMHLFGYVGNLILLLIVSVTIYWLAFFRGQSSFAFIFLPLDTQENIFKILIFVSFSLKFIDIVHLIFEQTSYDIFFIDWERPEQKQQQQKYVKLDENKVSCWRILFVANEWNEIQTYRKINRTFQLMIILFFLKVINLEYLALKQCEINLNENEYSSSYSSVLRIAVASSIFILTGLAQWIFHMFFYVRCFKDKISNFIDFCSVSNISMFIMTHSQFGYYIHGRSPYGNADISMQKMTEAMSNEKNNMTSRRGLEPGSDHQTFTIAVTKKLSKQYFKVMMPLNQLKLRNVINSANRTDEFEKRMLAYAQLNRFLVAFINNILREMKYLIVRRNLLESLLNFEFKMPYVDSYFYQDDITCFSQTIFYGNELKLFLFDLALFLFVDILAKNYVLSALVVYLITRILETFRSDMGKRNLSRKTLVDKRFLI